MNKRILFAGLLLLVGCAHGTAKKEEARTPNAVNEINPSLPVFCTVRNYDVSGGGFTGPVMFANSIVAGKEMLVVHATKANHWVEKVATSEKNPKGSVQVFDVTINGFGEPTIHNRRPMAAYASMTPEGLHFSDYQTVSIICKKLDKTAMDR